MKEQKKKKGEVKDKVTIYIPILPHDKHAGFKIWQTMEEIVIKDLPEVVNFQVKSILYELTVGMWLGHSNLMSDKLKSNYKYISRFNGEHSIDNIPKNLKTPLLYRTLYIAIYEADTLNEMIEQITIAYRRRVGNDEIFSTLSPEHVKIWHDYIRRMIRNYITAEFKIMDSIMYYNQKKCKQDKLPLGGLPDFIYPNWFKTYQKAVRSFHYDINGKFEEMVKTRKGNPDFWMQCLSYFYGDTMHSPIDSQPFIETLSHCRSIILLTPHPFDSAELAKRPQAWCYEGKPPRISYATVYHHKVKSDVMLPVLDSEGRVILFDDKEHPLRYVVSVPPHYESSRFPYVISATWSTYHSKEIAALIGIPSSTVILEIVFNLSPYPSTKTWTGHIREYKKMPEMIERILEKAQATGDMKVNRHQMRLLWGGFDHTTTTPAT